MSNQPRDGQNRPWNPKHGETLKINASNYPAWIIYRDDGRPAVTVLKRDVVLAADSMLAFWTEDAANAFLNFMKVSELSQGMRVSRVEWAGFLDCCRQCYDEGLKWLAIPVLSTEGIGYAGMPLDRLGRR